MQKNALTKGVLIAIEGIDGVGKSTQARRLFHALADSGYECLLLSEPTGGTFGKKIREMAKAGKRADSPEEEYRLFLLDRKENVEKNIGPALSIKKVVILDRYYFSTMAYQGALGLDPKRIREENEAFAPAPDLVFLLLLSVEEGLRRIHVSREKYTAFEAKTYLERVKSIFERDVAPLPFVRSIDGGLSEGEVFEAIKKTALELLRRLTQ